MYDKLTSVAELPFYDKLTEEQKFAVLVNSEIKSFPKGQTLSGLIDGKLGPFLVLEGELRAVMDDENLREITLFKLSQLDLGLLSTSCLAEYITFDVKFVVESDSTLLVIGTEIIEEIMYTNLAVKCDIFETIADRFSSSMKSVYDVFFLRYESRLALFLLGKYVVTGDAELHITQEEIAKMTSSVREVAGRTIRHLAREGILEYGRGKIKILDIHRLKELI